VRGYQSLPNTSPPAGVTADQKVDSETVPDRNRTLLSSSPTRIPVGYGEFGTNGLHLSTFGASWNIFP